jgi:hypothetical protein
MSGCRRCVRKKIDRHHLVPGFRRERLEAFGPDGARIVDQHVEAAGSGLDGRGDRFDSCRVGEVGRNPPAGAESRKARGGGFHLACLAGGNEDFGAMPDEAFGDHGADPARAARHQHPQPIDCKQSVHPVLPLVAGDQPSMGARACARHLQSGT